MTKYRFLISGGGSAGRSVAQVAAGSGRGEIAAVVDPQQAQLDRIKKLYPQRRHWQRLRRTPARDPARRRRPRRARPPARRSNRDGARAGLPRPRRKAARNHRRRLPADPRRRSPERRPRHDRPDHALHAPLAPDGPDRQVRPDRRHLLPPGRLHPRYVEQLRAQKASTIRPGASTNRTRRTSCSAAAATRSTSSSGPPNRLSPRSAPTATSSASPSSPTTTATSSFSSSRAAPSARSSSPAAAPATAWARAWAAAFSPSTAPRARSGKAKSTAATKSPSKIGEPAVDAVVGGHGWGRSVVDFLDLLDGKIDNPIPASRGAKHRLGLRRRTRIDPHQAAPVAPLVLNPASLEEIDAVA